MKRRKFVSHTMAASAVMSLNPWSCMSADVISQRPLYKKSLKWGMIKEDLSVMGKFQLIKDLGFHGVELDSPTDLDIDEVMSAMKATGVEVPGLVNSLHWSKPLSDPDPAIRKQCTDSMIESLALCKELGGTTVLLVPAVVKEHISYDDAWERSTAEIRKILPTAESTGIKIALENVWNNFLLSPLEAVRFIDQFESDAIGWYMDIGNIIRYGWPEQWIKILGSRIVKVDIKDYSTKLANEEGVWEGFKSKLGEGSVNWARVNQALSEVGYSGWGSAEVSGGDKIRLEDIAERMDKLYAK